MVNVKSIHVSIEAHRRLKLICIERGITIKELIEILSRGQDGAK